MASRSSATGNPRSSTRPTTTPTTDGSAVHRPRTLPLVGDLPAFRADRLGFLTELARRDGDVARFRIGPYRVWLLSDPDLVHDALVVHPGRFRKGPLLQRARIVLGDGLLTAEGAHHRRQRRLLQPAFHPDRVAGYAEVMVGRAAATTDAWRSGRPIDVHAQTVRMTLGTAGITLLGSEVEQDVELVEDALDDLLSAYRLAFVPFGWKLQRLPFGPPRRLRRGRTALHGLVDRMIAQRRADGRDRGDALSRLVLAGDAGGDAGGETVGSGGGGAGGSGAGAGGSGGAAGAVTGEPRPDGEALTDAELRDEALTLLLAGHETTANALAFACHLMAHDRDLEARIHAEVDAVLAGRLPTAADVERLPVCRGLFAESLRLFPPSWAISRQVVEPHPVRGHTVPVGDVVVLAPWVVHRDARWWPHPDRCDVDRWTRPPDADRPRWAFFPFGAGVRRCLGEGFAWTEGILALATIASRWRLVPVADRPLALDPLITLRPRGGVWLRPVRRGA